MISPTDVAGYGGRNGEIVITWTVSKPSVHVTPEVLTHIPALTKSKRCFFFFLFPFFTPDPLQPVQPWYFYGKKFGYIVAFKPHDAYDWWYETISDPETRRHVHRDSYFIPTDEDFQVREFQVKIKSFNVKGDGPYSLTKVIYYPRDGEDSVF